MWKMAAAGVTALFVGMSPVAYAQSYSVETRDRLSASDWNALTDYRIDLVKGALQLTPDQVKYWPAVEDSNSGQSQKQASPRRKDRRDGR